MMQWNPLAALLAVFLGPMYGVDGTPAERYFALRDRQPVVTEATPETLDSQEQRLVELRGMLVGAVQREKGGSFILNAQRHTWLVEVTDPELLASLRLGQEVRLLSRVASVEGANVWSLLAVAGLPEAEAATWEAARAEEAAAVRQAAEQRAAQQQGRTGPETSRGNLQITPPGQHPPQAAVPPPTVVVRDPTEDELVESYGQAVRYFNSRLSADDAAAIARHIIRYSIQYDIDARLVMAMIAAESNFNPRAVSPKGARGLGQLMPATARSLGVRDSFDPAQNLDGAIRYLSRHIQNYASQNGGEVNEEAIRLALAAYNAGSGAVARYGGIPPFRETRNYVEKVTRLYRQFMGEGG